LSFGNINVGHLEQISNIFQIFYIFILSGYSENVNARPKHETAILDKRASFECSVKSQNVAEIEIWWQFQNQNVTAQISDSHKVRIIRRIDSNILPVLSF
jgi:hypothetical protein